MQGGPAKRDKRKIVVVAHWGRGKEGTVRNRATRIEQAARGPASSLVVTNSKERRFKGLPSERSEVREKI